MGNCPSETQRDDSGRSRGIVAEMVFSTAAGGLSPYGAGMDASSVFEVGSIIKTFTATVLSEIGLSVARPKNHCDVQDPARILVASQPCSTPLRPRGRCRGTPAGSLLRRRHTGSLRRIVAAGAVKGVSVIGWRLEATGKVVVNPPKDIEVHLGADDQVLILGLRAH